MRALRIGQGLVGLEILAAEAVGDAPADLHAGRGAAVLHLVLLKTPY